MTKAYTLSTKISGSGPILVLLHGYLASSAYWEKLSSKLEKKNTVIRIDLLGFGLSPKPHFSKYDYNAQLASIEKTLQHHNIKSKFTLVGHSMGGLLALRYARVHAPQIKKLVLLNMPVLLTSKQAKREIYQTSIVFRLGLSRLFHSTLWNVFRLLRFTKLLPKMLRIALNDRLAYIFQSSSASRLRSFRNVIVKAKVIDDLQAIAVPTILVHGDKDRRAYLDNIPFLPVRDNIIQVIRSGAHHLPHTAILFVLKTIRA